MKSLVGTWTLIRLALRRDRFKLPIWIIALVVMVFSEVPAVFSFYGESYKGQVAYAATTAPSVVGRVFAGPIHGPEIGSIVMNELFLFTAIAIAFMSTLAVVRHTRQNEETGRAELIGSAVVGHQASLSAALVVTVVANIILAILLTLAFWVNSLSFAGSVAAGAALGTIGIVFAAIAAIAAQMTATARGANSLAAIVIGVAFLLRAIGDGLGTLVNNGLGVASAWPSWLSPFGWGQQIYAFSENNWWIFGIFGGFFVVVLSIAYMLNAHRDIGLAMLPARQGPAHAAKSLLSPFGLTWRLQKGAFIGWAISIGIMGGVIGIMSEEFKNLFEDNPDFGEAFGQSQVSGNFTDFFFAAMLALMAVVIVGYVVQSLLRMRSEEASGRLEPLLALPLSRTKWVAGHIIFTSLGAVVMLALLGITAGVSYVLATQSGWSEAWRVLGAVLAYVPALLVFSGLITLLFGLVPRFSVAFGWASFVAVYVIAQFGALLKLPQLVRDISPFTHVPAVPLDSLTWTSIISLSVIAAVLMLAGLFCFQQRNITTA